MRAVAKGKGAKAKATRLHSELVRSRGAAGGMTASRRRRIGVQRFFAREHAGRLRLRALPPPAGVRLRDPEEPGFCPTCGLRSCHWAGCDDEMQAAS